MHMPVQITALIKRMLYCFVIMPVFCIGQMSDDFSDGNFTINPSWIGEPDKFRINSLYQLQLYDDGADSAYLFTAVQIFPEMEWRCFIKQSFSPSGNNHSRIYLLADEDTSVFPPDGFFLQLGEGGSDDAIRFMKQSGGDTTSLIRGMAGMIASSFGVNIKTLYSEGNWQLFVDYSGEYNYINEGSYQEEIINDSGNLGVFCKYTSSNSTKFYFDDFYAGPIQYDTIPPDVQHMFVNPPDRLDVHFSESVEKESAEQTGNYHLSHNVGYPETAFINEQQPFVVHLAFADELPYGELLQLNILNVKDLSGNKMSAVVTEFSWYDPKRYDVVINEIMVDPSPPQLLPEYEYLELYNTTFLPLDLSGWILTIGTSEKELSGLRIASQGYHIIAKEEAESSFLDYGQFYGLEGFSLTNSGQDIILCNEKGEMISRIRYSDYWYRDEDKKEGGWSLEQINPYNPCLSRDNWQASKYNSGGSPGKINSVYDDVYTPIEIVSACVVDSVRIRVEFNQSLHMNTGLYALNFHINHGLGNPVAFLPEDPFFTTFILYPVLPLNRGIIYELSYESYIFNCMGDSALIGEAVPLGIPEKPVHRDLVINEILFNPFPGGSDYVEIYNSSDKVIQLTNLIIGSIKNNTPSPPDTTFTRIMASCRVIFPGDYVLFCSNILNVDNYYYSPDVKRFIESEGFPSYSNEKGTVILFDDMKQVLDVLSYHEDMHFPLLNSVEGVSLERIHYDRPSEDKTNWHSASQLSGFGTPGYKNSQFSEIFPGGGSIHLEPSVFTPNNDGYNDLLTIKYHCEKPGNLATIMVFNASGQLIRHLVNNELLGTSGSYSWDGIRNDRQKAAAGIYIILLELTNLSGQITHHKKTAIIATSQ
jgi:hypothetical protein